MTESPAALPGPFELGGWSYRFVRKLGQGGFGSVYEVERQKDGDPQRVAVKVLRADDGGGARGRFRDELRLLLRLDHPAFPRAYDVATVDGAEAVVMELVQGRALDFAAGRALPLRTVAEVGAEVAAALDDAWNFVPPGAEAPLHIAHRDIKPGNLMVDRTARVRVLDLGGASAASPYRDAETRRDGGSPLTPNYCAPEVPRSMVEAGTRGRIAGSPSEDVYALGATLVALATGAEYTSDWRLAPRFHQEALASLAGSPLHDVLTPTLALEPADRPSFPELKRRLRALLPGLPGPGLEGWVEAGMPTLDPLAPVPVPAVPAPVVASPSGPAASPSAPAGATFVPPAEPAPRPSMTPLVVVVAGVLGLALLVVVVAVGLLFAMRDDEPPPQVAVLVPPDLPADAAPLVPGSGDDPAMPAPGNEAEAPGAGATGDQGQQPAREASPPASPGPAEPVTPGTVPAPGGSTPATGSTTPLAPASGGEGAAPAEGGGRVEVSAEGGCEVRVDGVASASVSLPAGPHLVECRWLDQQGAAVEKSTRVTVAEGGTVRVECLPRLSRCAVKR